VEVYHGYSARSLIVEDGVVKGVRLAEVGLAHDGSAKGNHLPTEEIRAGVTILADGTHGVCSTEFVERFGGGTVPMVYALGLKAIVQFPEASPFGTNRVMHTLGYPVKPSMFGGGFLYAMGEKTVAVGLILGLDWKYGDLNPQREFETLRAHPFISRLLKGGVTVATGAKTIPEGGYNAIGTISAPGGMVVGDGAGFVNMEKIKGIHYAMRSGMAAAETAVEALREDGTVGSLDGYRARLEGSGMLAELRHARNYRQLFKYGLFVGTPLSLVSSFIPATVSSERDGDGTKKGARINREDPGRMDGATFVALTGTIHREDEPSHITITDPAKCASCEADYANSCTHFCPGQVYRWSGTEIVLSPSNCLHCMTCTVKCPQDVISWVPPEGGEGPRYKQL
jgi:electron-transferring-flavoprotein dehydrogenase